MEPRIIRPDLRGGFFVYKLTMGGVPITSPATLDVSKIQNKRILALGAHSDDMEFLAAGTLIQLAPRNTISIVIATDGRMGTHDHDQNTDELVSMRMTEAQIAAKKMGIADVNFWSYPDLGLQFRKKHLLRRVVKHLLKVRPDIVITFDPWGKYDALVHPDHRTLGWAVVEGVLYGTLPQWVARSGLGKQFLTPKPQVWLMAPGEANVVVDISPVWEHKLANLQGFVSQFDREVQWEHNKQWLELEFGRIGDAIGVEYGEAFRILEYMGEWNLKKL